MLTFYVNMIGTYSQLLIRMELNIRIQQIVCGAKQGHSILARTVLVLMEIETLIFNGIVREYKYFIS